MKLNAQIVILLVVIISLAAFGLWSLTNWGQRPGPGSGGTNQEWGQRPGTGSGQGTSGEFQIPDVDASKPQSNPPYVAELKTLQLGNLQITYKSVTASYSPMTMGTDLYIRVKNTGTKSEILHITPLKQLVADYVPKWCMHFFAFQSDDLTVASGEEKILHYFASNDDSGQFDVKIDFWQTADKSDKVTATIKFYSGTRNDVKLYENSVIYGEIKEKGTGKKIDNADLSVNLFSGRESKRIVTDGMGRYSAVVTSSDDLAKFFDQEQYSYDYFITVDKEGYEYYYADGIKPKPGEKIGFDIELEPATSSPAYKMNWESKVSDYYGFFWALVDDGWKYVVGSQAKHTPELGKPTNFYLFDANTGNQLWKYPTGNECWGIDITRDGSLVAAGCHDNYVYVVNANDGSLKWKKDCGGICRIFFLRQGAGLLMAGRL